MTGRPVHFWKSLLPSFTSDSRVNFLSFYIHYSFLRSVFVPSLGPCRTQENTIKFLILGILLGFLGKHPMSKHNKNRLFLTGAWVLACLPFLRPFPPFIHCFPRIKIKESYWLGSSGREVRGKGHRRAKGTNKINKNK